jgi:four helix bundle protein
MPQEGRDIQDRAFRFACDVVTFCDASGDRRPTTQHILVQLLECGTSLGANLAEASAGQSKPDFISKVSISRKEAFEALYWLRLIEATRRALAPAAHPLVSEADALARILTAIVRNARSNPHRGGHTEK